MASNKNLKTKESFKSKLKLELGNSNRPPFLFAGSGLSIRYSGIPTWLWLLEEFVKSHDCFTSEFGYYSSKCSQNPLKIASVLAEEFHEHWWNSEEFKDSRELHKSIAGKDTEVAFKIELANFVKSKQGLKTELRDEIDLLKSTVLSGILTTNWDDFLENLFSDFDVKIGQKEMIFSEQRSLGDIYKIHGCVSRPDSLVVTEKDYENFINKNHYLNSKILTLFVDYPILFMGYSLSDPNIEEILKNIVDCLDTEYLHIEKLQGRLFFVEWQSELCSPTIESSTYNLKSVQIPIKKIKVHSYKEIFEVLSDFPRKFSVNMLKQLQRMVYDFVLTTEPTKKIMVNGLEDLDKIEDLEVVVGFGNISKLQGKGVVGLKALDLIRDILFDDINESNYTNIVEDLLPSLVRKGTYIPFFKYQKLTQNLNEDNSILELKKSNYVLERSKNISIADYRVPSQIITFKKKVQYYKSIQELIVDLDFTHAIAAIPHLEKNIISIPVLRKFLKSNWGNIEYKDSHFSNYRKCICILDYLENAYH